MWRFFILALCCALPVQASEEHVVLGLSKDQVSITTDFDGSDILIYGAIKRDFAVPEGAPVQVIVTLSGPENPLTVRRKERQFGIWANADAAEIASAPDFYAVATSAPFNEILRDEEDKAYRVSVQRAIQAHESEDHTKETTDFVDAVIRIRENGDKYALNENSVQVNQQTLFRTDIEMPPDLTEGEYKVRVLLTRYGKVVTEHQGLINVQKVGLERFLFNLSREQPFLYGIMSLAIAIFAGWSASAVFRLIKSG
ncbi:TIGR02186 family protein [Epibacterium ulvae]|uniref:TIGR02186 family protein n=1 Tax=Epibacterium ulvae TaxID=1156985 RepID=UPI00249247CE|nr:TIGR02186 family protein [Epibacterium ulvae]